MKLLAMILIGWLALAEVGADPLQWFSFWKSSNTVNLGDKLDFDGLNKYITEKLPKNYDVKKNLALIESDYSKLTYGARSAAWLLQDVANFGNHCDRTMLSRLKQLRGAKDVSLEGDRRVEDLLRPGWMKARKVCSKYISQSHKQANPRLTKFIGELCPYCDQFKKTDGKGKFPAKYMYAKLKNLAKGTQFDTALASRRSFDRAYDELLLEPCESITSYGQLVSTMLALFEAKTNLIQPNTDVKHYFDIDTLLLDLIWTEYTCRKLLVFGSRGKDLVFDAALQPD